MPELTIKYLFLAGLWSGGATAACSVYLGANRRDIAFSGILGVCSWILYVLLYRKTGIPAAGYFVGAFAVAVISEILAVVLHNPATVYLIPGILPLVPGAGIFSMMRSAILEGMTVALQKFYEVLGAAGSIVLGIAIASSVFKMGHVMIKKSLLKNRK